MFVDRPAGSTTKQSTELNSGLYNDTLPIICEGKVHGKISINSSGDGGFGYDKIFYPDGFSSSMASLDEETKNIISE